MKAIYLDCFSGISGNLLLGAFLQAGVPASYLERELAKLGLASEYGIKISDVIRGGIRSVYVEVKLTGTVSEHDAPMEHHHEHSSEAHQHADHHHVHRTMRDIRAIIEGSSLSAPVRQQSLAIFETVARAEGKVHGQPLEEVHFHEVGAVDSIVDIVGTAICLDYLEIKRVFASPINVGSGMVRCAHGVMPVPAPATAELLTGWSWYQNGTCELATPTGAAVIRTLAEPSDRQGLPTGFVTEKIAYGAGGWELELPDVLRMYVGEYEGAAEAKHLLLETNIDDMSPEIYSYLYDKLFAAGALDVWTTPIYMKKNRPAEKLSVLVNADTREACIRIIFRETTTIGLRVLPLAERIEASRHMAQVDTPYGRVACKVSAYAGEIVNVAPEYEDCRRLAEAADVPLKFVQQAATEALRARLG